MLRSLCYDIYWSVLSTCFIREWFMLIDHWLITACGWLIAPSRSCRVLSYRCFVILCAKDSLKVVQRLNRISVCLLNWLQYVRGWVFISLTLLARLPVIHWTACNIWYYRCIWSPSSLKTHIGSLSSNPTWMFNNNPWCLPLIRRDTWIFRVRVWWGWRVS